MLADRARRLTPSPTLALSARARALRAQGIDVLSFTAGEPDFDTPERVKEAAVRAIREGHTKYTDAGGIPELKSAICAKLKRDSGLAYESWRGHRLGGREAHALQHLRRAREPGRRGHRACALLGELHGAGTTLRGRARRRPERRTPGGSSWTWPPSVSAVTPRTKFLLLNSPNNPSGAVYPRADLERVAALALERGFYVVSDECYDALSYEGPVPSIAALGPEIKARTIVVNTCSKAYAMTGWRLGFAAGPREIVKAMSDLQGQCTSNPTSIAQWAAAEALGGPQDEVAKMAGEFDQRRRVIVAGLNRIPGWKCPMPQGAFYAFPDVSGLFGRRFNGQALHGSADVTAFLLEAARVAVVPGADFGSDRHLRISYACGLDQIREGLARIEAACAGLEG